jgi:hypothetical protein
MVASSWVKWLPGTQEKMAFLSKMWQFQEFKFW